MGGRRCEAAGFSSLPLIFRKAGSEGSESAGRVLFEALLIHVDEAVGHAALRHAGSGGIGRPEAEAGHFLGEVEFLAAFGFDDPDGAGRIKIFRSLTPALCGPETAAPLYQYCAIFCFRKPTLRASWSMPSTPSSMLIQPSKPTRFSSVKMAS